ncbi:MAG: twin-arginine translocase subunit TatC [Solirubrobacteraceae bacterium]
MIGHKDELSLVDHLEELRSRIIICLVAFGVAFAVCFWQNHALLRIINAPLAQQTKTQVREGRGPLGGTWLAQHATLMLGHSEEGVIELLTSSASNLSPRLKAQLEQKRRQIKADIAKLPRKPEGANPTTIAFGEPFTQTLTVAFYAALLISLPVLLYELYGFVLPAFKPEERRVAMPLLLAVPFLFALGVAFGYFVVLPAATHFFQNFNSGQFNVLVQAKSYYKFASLVLIAMGVVFQVPVGVLAVTEAEILTPADLRKGRRYALVACAAVAAFIPGEVVTMLLETIPLYLLYELSVLIASVVARRRERRAVRTGSRGRGDDDGGGGGGTVLADDRPEPPDRGGELLAVGAPDRGAAEDETDSAVREMLDHIDPDLHG